MSTAQHSLPSASAPVTELPLAAAAVRSVEWSRRWWPLSPVMVDAAMVTIVSLAATVNAFLSGRHANPPIWIVAFGGVTFLVLRGRSRSRLGLGGSMLDQLAEVVTATTAAATILIAVHALVSRGPDIGGQTVRLWAFFTVYLFAGRVLPWLDGRRRGADGLRALKTLIVGSCPVSELLARRLLHRPELGLRPVGFLGHPPSDHNRELPLPVLGVPDEIERHVRSHDIDHVVVGFHDADPSVMLSLVRRCRHLGLGVSVVPRLYEEVTSRTAVEHLGGLPLLTVPQADPRSWQFGIKYALDRVAAALGLLFLAPLMLAIAVAVRATSPGPALYRQRRVGLDGREFDILKFRTMAHSEEGSAEPGEEAAAAMLRHLPQDGHDRRTGLGRYLRKSSLDELPQLLNVLRGDMSFIGPRPERPSLVASFERRVYRYGDRHRVKSGMTGWAQVNGLRGKTSVSDRIEWDNYYIENWSPWLDLKIALLTVPTLLFCRNGE